MSPEKVIGIAISLTLLAYFPTLLSLEGVPPETARVAYTAYVVGAVIALLLFLSQHKQANAAQQFA